MKEFLKNSGLYRLYKSSGFWFIIIGFILIVSTWFLTQSELAVSFVGALLGIEKTGKQIEDNTRTNKGIVYNPKTQKHEKIGAED